MTYNDEDEKKSKIVFTLPSSNTNKKNGDFSPKDIELKDRLMKLIIDTKDEEIELKVNGDQYRKVGIHDEWRQVDFNSKKATYFSYQEKAAKDFIYRFNKCGILSDQVGMGKTIEAGMIISELSYRKELGSLLILVPNENMAEKWEIELARKFGFRNFFKDIVFLEGKEEKVVPVDELPKVASIKSLDDVYSIIFTAYNELYANKKNNFNNIIKNKALELFDKICDVDRIKNIKLMIQEYLNKVQEINSKEFKMLILKNVYAPLIKNFVEEISIELGFDKEFKESNYKVDLSGTYYHIVDMYLDIPIIENSTVNEIVNRLIDRSIISNSIVGEFGFIKAKKGKAIIKKINKENANLVDSQEDCNLINKYKEISKKIKQQYAILIVSKIVNNGKSNINLLDFCLDENFESESLRHCSVSAQIEKGYTLIDMLIDMSYKTLIVDEAHDYIKVSHKKRMRDDIISIKDYEKRQRDGIEFSDLDMSEKSNSSLKYFVFPLYNDYYFVEKDCLYLKVKSLAERSYRKIFMTATPIKSDMIDFYLLYLLADNSDTNTFSRIRKVLTKDSKNIRVVVSLIINAMNDSQKRSLNYYTLEDVAVHYIYQYYKNNQDSIEGSFDKKIEFIINDLIKNKNVDLEIIKEICINKVRLQFQKTFTIRDRKTDEEKEITSIAALVSSDEGIEQWQNMYSQIGIRSTRHQTFRLDKEHLDLINPVQRDKYRNLPVWSRRNGTIIYIHKKDNFFDLVVRERLRKKKEVREKIIDDEDKIIYNDFILKPKESYLSILKDKKEQNIAGLDEEDYNEKIRENKIKELEKKYNIEVEKLERKFAPKETAMDIYRYINKQLTGKLSIADYYSTDVDYDDFKLHMVAKLMTDGLEIGGEIQPKKINGKVLLFTDASTYNKVFEWLQKENDYINKTMTQDDIETYRTQYKHYPLWYHNMKQENEEDKWVITNEIKALKEKKGNYLIVVEPNKYEEGVDLQTSNTLINFDIKFCPLKMEQRIGRIDRVKLGDEQPQLDIISFTPLNDMSGFMVDFLANELKMFSCWKGDTTGIVSMPLGEKPNSATFESAILSINDAYKNLYDFKASKFIDSCKKIVEMGNNFSNNNFVGISNLLKCANQIEEDFKYLNESGKAVNKIVINSDYPQGLKDEEYVSFDQLYTLILEKGIKDGNTTKESLRKHQNSLKDLKNGIDLYYKSNVESLEKRIENILKAIDSTISGGKNVDKGVIATDKDNVQEILSLLNSRLSTFRYEYKKYTESELYKLKNSALGIKKIDLDKVIDPIFNRYKSTVNKYLDVLIDLFDKFCMDVKDKSSKMTRFISYLTIEEFKVMAGNYE